ncbi:MucR family transcriptional regulator, partial [Methylobacterium radiotolerans]
MDDNATEQQQTFIEQASDIVSAYVSNNSVPISELPGLLAGVHAALTKLSAPAAAVTETADKPTPAQIRKSVTPDALISFIDGKPY